MIPSSLYDAYNTALTENDRQCIAALEAIVDQLDPDDIDGIRDALLEAYPALVRVYGERAAQVAMEFYMEVRDAEEVPSEYSPELPVAAIGAAVALAASDVRREIGGLYSGGSTLESFVSKMGGLATKRTMQMADDTIYSIADADPAHPKVALVPHAGACAWCVMIGSRGFTNTEKAMENMRHDGCKCTTVVDFDRHNPALRGYDPDELYSWYAPYSGNFDFQAELIREWSAMSDEEKAKYVRRVRNPKTGEVKEYAANWTTYVRNRTMQRMNVDLGHTSTTLIDKMKR